MKGSNFSTSPHDSPQTPVCTLTISSRISYDWIQYLVLALQHSELSWQCPTPWSTSCSSHIISCDASDHDQRRPQHRNISSSKYFLFPLPLGPSSVLTQSHFSVCLLHCHTACCNWFTSHSRKLSYPSEPVSQVYAPERGFYVLEVVLTAQGTTTFSVFYSS